VYYSLFNLFLERLERSFRVLLKLLRKCHAEHLYMWCSGETIFLFPIWLTCYSVYLKLVVSIGILCISIVPSRVCIIDLFRWNETDIKLERRVYNCWLNLNSNNTSFARLNRDPYSDKVWPISRLAHIINLFFWHVRRWPTRGKTVMHSKYICRK